MNYGPALVAFFFPTLVGFLVLFLDDIMCGVESQWVVIGYYRPF